MIKPVLEVGKYAIMVDDDGTTVYDSTTGKALFYLTAAGEYALTRMLIEKSSEWTDRERAVGEETYRTQVLPEKRQLVLS